MVISAFLTPANAMLSVELSNLADMVDAAGQFVNISSLARDVSSRIGAAIWNTTVSPLLSASYLSISVYARVCKVTNGIFAYETNGLGSGYVMDDANVPVRPSSTFLVIYIYVYIYSCHLEKSLLSLPYLGFLGQLAMTMS